MKSSYKGKCYKGRLGSAFVSDGKNIIYQGEVWDIDFYIGLVKGHYYILINKRTGESIEVDSDTTVSYTK